VSLAGLVTPEAGSVAAASIAGLTASTHSAFSTASSSITFIPHLFFSPPPSQVPMKTIASNAGVEGAVIIGKVEEQADPSMGYNAATDEYTDMVKAGIIDPLKVVRTALVDAASVSSLITTSECVIVEAPEEKKAAPAMPDMGMY
jgi:hypothetical protein